jgi:hypothetical protein
MTFAVKAQQTYRSNALSLSLSLSLSPSFSSSSPLVEISLVHYNRDMDITDMAKDFRTSLARPASCNTTSTDLLQGTNSSRMSPFLNNN